MIYTKEQIINAIKKHNVEFAVNDNDNIDVYHKVIYEYGDKLVRTGPAFFGEVVTFRAYDENEDIRVLEKNSDYSKEYFIPLSWLIVNKKEHLPSWF